MALSSFYKDNLMLTIKLSDGTGTPLTLTLTFDDGNFGLSGLRRKLREIRKYERKGLLVSTALGNRVYPSLQFGGFMAQFTEATAGTITDFLTQKAATPYAAGVSTRGASDPGFTCDVEITIEGTDYGDAADHVIVCEDCDFSLDFSSGEPNKFQFSAEVLGAITGDLDFAQAA